MTVEPSTLVAAGLTGASLGGVLVLVTLALPFRPRASDRWVGDLGAGLITVGVLVAGVGVLGLLVA